VKKTVQPAQDRRGVDVAECEVVGYRELGPPLAASRKHITEFATAWGPRA
jgi:hypothetical protein